MPWLCCTHKSRRRSEREDQYKVKEAPGGETQFSWDKRETMNTADMIIQNVNGGEVVKRDFKREPVIIENCKESTIVVLGHSATVNVDDCRDCLIFLGPCAGSVFIRDCDNCKVLVVCQQLRTRDCRGIKIAVRCTSEPIIEESSDMTFYPLALYYPQLKEDMRNAKLSPLVNKAISVHDFTAEKGREHYRLARDAIDLAPEEESVLSSFGIETSSEESLFPLKHSVLNLDSMMFAFHGKIIEHSPEQYQQSQNNFIEKIEGNSKLLLAFHFDLDLMNRMNTGYQRIALPLGGYARICIVGVLGKEDEFSSVLLSHPQFKRVDYTESLISSLKETDLLSVD